MTTKTNAAVANAVQNTTTEQVPLVEVMKNLDKKDIALAWKAIESAYSTQANIEDLEAKVEKARGAIGNSVLSIARAARAHCNAKGYDLVFAMHYFKALCTDSENKLVSKYMEKSGGEKKTISTLIPVWPTHKSNIAKGMELGIDPLERDEISDTAKYLEATPYVAAMKALVAESGANNTGSQAGNERKSSEQTAKILGTITSGWDSSLKAATEVLNQQLNRLDKDEQLMWAGKVLALAAEVTTYADSPERKAMLDAKLEAIPEAPVSGDTIEDATGKVVGTTSSTEDDDAQVEGVTSQTDEGMDDEGPISQAAVAALQKAVDDGKKPTEGGKGKRKAA